LRLENVSLSHPLGTDRPDVLAHVWLHATPGEFAALVSESRGTLDAVADVLLGRRFPEKGRVFLDDQDVTRLPPLPRSRLVAAVPARGCDGVVPRFTVAENLAFAFGVTDKHPLRRALKSHDKVLFRAALQPLGGGLEERLDERAARLTELEQLMLALRMALLVNPKLVALREPDDLSLAEDMRRYLETARRLCKAQDVTALFLTRNTRAARALSERTFRIAAGGVSLEGLGAPPQEKSASGKTSLPPLAKTLGTE